MNTIFFVYEIDGHRAWASMAVKGIFLDAEKALQEYNRNKGHWKDSHYLLCIGYIEESAIANPTTDIMCEMQELHSTEQ